MEGIGAADLTDLGGGGALMFIICVSYCTVNYSVLIQLGTDQSWRQCEQAGKMSLVCGLPRCTCMLNTLLG